MPGGRNITDQVDNQRAALQTQWDAAYAEFIASTKLDDKQAKAERDRLVNVLDTLDRALGNTGVGRGGSQSKKNQYYQAWNPAREEFVVADNAEKLKAAQDAAKAEAAKAKADALSAAAADKKKAENEFAAAAIKAQKEQQTKIKAEATRVNGEFLSSKSGQARAESRAQSGSLLSFLGLKSDTSAAEAETEASKVGREQQQANVDMATNQKKVIDVNTGRKTVFETKRKTLLSQPVRKK